ncbi:MAG: hypothetical protein IJG63_00760 [Oscillospiraceae bacterium]|nr:hypothetical protein [Oscillospiraceae bacterium]
MAYEAERRFVERFVRRDRRERLLYELTNQNKRYDGLSRFCHHTDELLDKGKLIMQGEDLDRRAEFLCFVKEHDERCLIMSPDGSLDGEVLPFNTAVERAVSCFDAVIILGSSFAVVLGEVVKKGRGKYLLSDERKT